VGLAVLFHAVQLHNGAIGFTNELNHGTTFRITLPTGAPHAPQSETQ